MKSVVAAAAVAGILMSGGSSAAGADPWDLHCRAMPLERPVPAALRSVTLRFFPWVRPAAKALRAGPVYLVALSSATRISRDGDSRDSSDYYLHRAVVAIAPTYTGQVTITGRLASRSTRRGALGFSVNGATSCGMNGSTVSCGDRALRFSQALRVRPGAGWRIVRTELRIGRTGCFSITAAGSRLHAVIPLAVPGPDYGTTGW